MTEKPEKRQLKKVEDLTDKDVPGILHMLHVDLTNGLGYVEGSLDGIGAKLDTLNDNMDQLNENLGKIVLQLINFYTIYQRNK